jgi:hypothetical protein
VQGVPALALLLPKKKKKTKKNPALFPFLEIKQPVSRMAHGADLAFAKICVVRDIRDWPWPTPGAHTFHCVPRSARFAWLANSLAPLIAGLYPGARCRTT